MKGSLAIVFCSVILLVSGQEQPVAHEEFSQERQDALNVILDYMACIDEGKCVSDENTKPVDQSPEISSIALDNAPAEHEELPEIEPCPEDSPVPESHYCAPCPKYSSKFEELESLHPELKSLKLQFAERFDSYVSGVSCDLKGASLVNKILDLVILVAEELKKDFTCQEYSEQIPVEEIFAEEHGSDEIGFVGSVRGIPGVHYPNYTEVPITSFNCADKKYIPGFYADLETGCQVFHVCYEHRRESFLCPLGTIFNQPILACDYWYSSNCSLAPIYYDVNEKKEVLVEEPQPVAEEPETTEDLTSVAQFLPVKAKIVEFPTKPEAQIVVSSIDGVEEVAEKIFDGIVSKSTLAASKARAVVNLFPKQKSVMKPLPLVKSKLAVKAVAVPLVKAKAVAAAVPIVKAKVAAAAGAVPIVKAKAVAAAVPIVKAKVAAAAAVPIVKAKAVAVPVVKAKVISAATVPIVKAKVIAKTPALKAKLVAAAAVPVAKAKVAVPFYKVKAVAAASKPVKVKVAAAAVPVFKVKKMAKVVPVVAAVKPKLAVDLVKAKVIKSAVISPLTKKALALGYLKLLKAKKLALG